jgi:hypothetical protein
VSEWDTDAVRRVIRAQGERVAWQDEFELGELASLRADLDAAIAYAVRGQRRNREASWADIGAALGVTKAAAFQRYREPEAG